VSQVARFDSPHDLASTAVLLPDGRRVVYVTGVVFEGGQRTRGTDPALWIGDLSDPKHPRKLTGHGPGLIHLAVGRDGRRALTASVDRTLRLWDLSTGTSRRLRQEEAALGPVAWAPDERRVAYVFGPTAIRLYDLETGRVLRALPGHQDRITEMAFCPDGRRLVSCGHDGAIRIWDVEAGKEIGRMHHWDTVADLAFFPDGRRVLTGSWDTTFGVWDLETQRQLRRIVGIVRERRCRVAVAPDGRRALFGSGLVAQLWDLETGEAVARLSGHGGAIVSLGFSADGRQAVTSAVDKTVRVWRLPPGRTPGAEPPVPEVAEFLGPQPGLVEAVAVSPDGRRLLTGSWGKSMRLWDRDSCAMIRDFSEHGGRVLSVAFSPDGRRALSGGEDSLVRLWDLESGERLRELRGHTEWIFSLAFTPDGRLALSTSGGKGLDQSPWWQDGTDSTVRIWDVAAGKQVDRLEGHKGMVRSVSVSPDGRQALSGGSDLTVILWDLKNRREVRRLRGHQNRVEVVAFLPDGRRAVSASLDRTIRLWDLRNGQELDQFRGHTTAVSGLAVAPDGRWLLSASNGGHELRLWDVQTRNLVHRFDWGNALPTQGTFLPDSRHALWAGPQGVVRMYRLPEPGQDQTSQSPASTRAAAGTP
jgi:WD40 repeat protein